ncbi:MAG: carbohydrate porin [Succinivibrio sp.]|nr:carbohydrate porin [Succinivibrio sp.]
MKKVNLLLAAVVAASVSAPAFADYTPNATFFGYMRSAVAFDKNGHNNGGDGTKKVGRLGNESSNYAEIGIGSDVAKIGDTVWTVNSMLRFSTENQNDWVALNNANGNNNYKDDGQIALGQFNVTAKGLFDFDKDAVVWIGKRYYAREDIHITDDYYYDISGNGVGVENLSLGTGKFQFAYIQRTEGGADGHLFDARYNFPLWDGATFQIGELYTQRKNVDSLVDGDYSADDKKFMKDNEGIFVGDLWLVKSDITKSKEIKKQKVKKSYDQLNGNVVTLEFTQGFSGGWNKTVFQWMTGANAGSRCVQAYGNTQDGNYYRVYNFGDTKLSDNLGLQHVVQYGYADYDDDTKFQNWQAVVRPHYQLTKMTKLVAEFGAYGQHNEDKKGNKVHETLQKATLAYAINPDASNMWSRPEIRFFVTWLHSNESNVVNTALNDYAKTDPNTVDITVGACVEAWW